MKYVCSICGYEYDEEKGAEDLGIAPGTKFEDLPEDFACPLCGAESKVIHFFVKITTFAAYVDNSCIYIGLATRTL